jgi:hypothetical protein
MMAPRIPVPNHLRTIYGSPDAYAAYDPSIKAWRLALAQDSAPAGALDAVTMDLVRLRNAFLQGCNT